MSNTVQLNTCPQCGAPIPAEAPQHLCPRCVLRAAAQPVEPTGAPGYGYAPTATGEIPSIERIAAAFPQLEILELIGRGGMGFVFKARQPHLDRLVALKLLPDQLARDPHFAERFNREGRVLARLNHPNIVSVFDFGQTSGFCYLLMEYVDGVNLRQAMQAGRFSPAEALSIVPRICEALQYAHEQGILHRDIKPENILLDTRGRVKIADFGIAKLIGEDAPKLVTLTHAGAALGTPHYMAPEQLEKPSAVDHRADIYSLGVVFYEMLTGELPLGRFAPPSAKTPVDRQVDDLVFRTLEKDRERRFQSAGEVKTQIEHLAHGGTAAGPSAAHQPPAGSHQPQGPGHARPGLAPHEDFILCPPVLPRMAKAFIVYALAIAPVFWLVSLLTVTMDPTVPKHPLAAFAHVAFNIAVAGVELILVGLLVTAAWKLRSLRPSAVTWMKTALWLHLLGAVAAMAGALMVEHLATITAQGEAAPPLERISPGEALFGALGFAALAFEIGLLVWLRRRGDVLRPVLTQPRHAAPPGIAGSSTGSSATFSPRQPDSILSRKALAGGLTALGSAALVGLLAVLTGMGGGLGFLELLIVGAVTLGGAIVGTSLGWMGLREIRVSEGRVHGLPFALIGALLWPILLTTPVALLLPYALVAQDGPNSILAPLPARVLLFILPAGTIAFVLWAVHTTIRWATRQDNHPPRRGFLKWVFVAVLAIGIGVSVIRQGRSRSENAAPVPAPAGLPALTAPAADSWVQLTIREVRIRTGNPGTPPTDRWLVLVYDDEVHGECDIVFNSSGGIANSGTQLHGSTRQIDATEPGGAPRVEHHLEYRLPDSMSPEAVSAFRERVERNWRNKPLVIQPESSFTLIDLDLGAQGRVRIEATGQHRQAKP